MAVFFLIIEIIFLIFLGIQVCYYTVFALASHFKFSPKLPEKVSFKKIVVFIPGYKEDRIIIDTAKQALKQSYPREYYEVVILADSFKPETLAELKNLDVRLLEVKFENSTKAKSINRGLEFMKDTHPDIAVVLDADNVMIPDFLDKINQTYQAENKVIQGHRTAKNQNTTFALLDAINEEISNSILRKGHRVMGMSSALIGSGMAFDYNYFCEIMKDILDVAGEDKQMELTILKHRQHIEYLPKAYVYDEKVSNARNFSKQRTRWVGVQLYYLKHYFFDGVKELFLRGNVDYFDKAFQMLLIPKVLLVGLLSVLSIFSLCHLLSIWWFWLTVIYFLALLLAVPRRFYNRKLVVAVLNIPLAIIFMILAILRIRRSTASKFEVTEKGNN